MPIVPVHLAEIFPDRYFRVCTSGTIAHAFHSKSRRDTKTFGSAGSHEDYSKKIPAHTSSLRHVVHAGSYQLTDPAANPSRHSIACYIAQLFCCGDITILSTDGSIRGSSGDAADDIE